MSDPSTAPTDAPISTWRKKIETYALANAFPGWEDSAAIVERTVTVNRSTADLYAFWRDLSNLPRFMHNINRIDVLDDTRSHWVVKAPGEQVVEWNAAITEAVDGQSISWRSEDGADVRNAGRVTFRDAAP